MIETKGAFGWPILPSLRFAGEGALTCPKCAAQNWTMGTYPGARGTAPGGRWRMGDTGGADFIRCNECKHETVRV